MAAEHPICIPIPTFYTLSTARRKLRNSVPPTLPYRFQPVPPCLAMALGCGFWSEVLSVGGAIGLRL